MTLPTLTTYSADAPLIHYSVETTGVGHPFVETWEARKRKALQALERLTPAARAEVIEAARRREKP